MDMYVYHAEWCFVALGDLFLVAILMVSDRVRSKWVRVPPRPVLISAIVLMISLSLFLICAQVQNERHALDWRCEKVDGVLVLGRVSTERFHAGTFRIDDREFSFEMQSDELVRVVRRASTPLRVRACVDRYSEILRLRRM